MTTPCKYETATSEVPGVRDRRDPGRMARLAIAMADDRPIALVFPAGRRVVLDRLRKLLEADEVRLADRVESEGVFGRGKTGPTPAPPEPGSLALLVDSSLLNARSLEVRSAWRETVSLVDLETWLTTAEPGLGFFTEPDADSRRPDLARP